MTLRCRAPRTVAAAGPAVRLHAGGPPGGPDAMGLDVHPDDRDRVLSADVESNRNVDEHFSMEYRMISKDGRILWVQDTCSLVNVPGKPPYWQGFILDITERKEAEEQLARALVVEREATQRLRSLDEMKNTFLQAVSHDLRTPLAAILGLAITLERATSSSTRTTRRTWRDGSRQRAQAGPARHEPARPRPARARHRGRRSCMWPTSDARPAGAVGIRADRRRASGDRTPTRMVRADAAQVERIVENLVANTIRYTPSTARSGCRSPRPRGGAARRRGRRRRRPRGAPRLDLRAVPPGHRGATHNPGVGIGLTLVTSLRRAARRTGVGRGSRRRRRIVPGAVAVRAAGDGGGRRRPIRRRLERFPGRDGRARSAVTAPTCAAQPGDPIPDTESLKNSALTGVNRFDSPGTSSS